MHNQDSAIPRLPRLAATALRPLPLAPVSVVLTALTRNIVRRNPGLFARLGAYRAKSFILDLTDLPFGVLLDVSGAKARVTAHRGAPVADVQISGSLAAFLGMVHGAYDGDALFFSRDLAVSGDTAAALALRNAIDDSELDFAAEVAALSGPLRIPLDKLINLVERRSGVALHRVGAAGTWQ
ncbi:MAG: SCP2 sterol-binding domain-containing protein [Pseudorhodobacter sp.]|nr:SCP2 sterol-binding domain-containing protein [Pseudorhodobacter sp.]